MNNISFKQTSIFSTFNVPSTQTAISVLQSAGKGNSNGQILTNISIPVATTCTGLVGSYIYNKKVYQPQRNAFYEKMSKKIKESIEIKRKEFANNPKASAFFELDANEALFELDMYKTDTQINSLKRFIVCSSIGLLVGIATVAIICFTRKTKNKND